MRPSSVFARASNRCYGLWSVADTLVHDLGHLVAADALVGLEGVVGVAINGYNWHRCRVAGRNELRLCNVWLM